MQEQVLIIKYTNSKNCFLHLPLKIHRQYFVQGTCIAVKHNELMFYLTCDPKPLRESDDDTCALNFLFAQSMGLSEGDAIVCNLVTYSGSLKSIHIIPFTSDDWDLMETNSSKVQTTFMDQVRVVCNKQILTLWCSRTLCIKFQVVNLDPNVRMGYLENDTQVIVVHPDEKDTFEKPTETTWTISQFLKNQFFKKPQENDEVDEELKMLQELEILFKKFNKHKIDVYRTVPFRTLFGEHDEDYFVVADKNYLPQNYKPSNVYEMRKVAVCQKYLKKDEAVNNIKFYVKLYTIDSLSTLDNNHNVNLRNFFTNCINNTLVISNSICEILNLNMGDRVVLENVKELNELQSIDLNFGLKNQNIDASDLADLFKQYIARKSKEYKVLIPNKVKLQLNDESAKFVIEVNLKPDDLLYAELNPDIFSRVSVNIIFEHFVDNDNEYKFNNYDFGIDKLCKDLCGFEQIIENCYKNIIKDFGKLIVPQNILIVGSEGSGKTSLAKSICQQLATSPHFYHVRIVQCKSLKGRRCESILNEIGSALYDTMQRSPSVIVFDDLEQILKLTEPEKDAPDVILMTNRLADIFQNLILTCQKHHLTCVIATCQSTRMLNSRIYSARGQHLFSEVCKVPDLDREDRIKIMQHLLNQSAYLESKLDWKSYSELCEGFVLQDFVDFAQRAIFQALKNKAKTNNELGAHLLTACHNSITKALMDTRPLGIKTNANDMIQTVDATDTWNAIGGLKDVKEELLQLVKWPSLYPKVFMNAPIMLSRGVLLYGPPGCGKTLLGTILAKYCKLRLIRVRGPELLGKYAGESERQVRDVFKRAQSARPCILFFDEFDSLAPRRGHDTSGVSDRVVNQLLTELDGCESRDVTGGVFILAATSRPDLIDPALLRPGRLDPQFHCSIPDMHRRFDILKTLIQYNKQLKMVNDEEENQILMTVAQSTDGFSGADLSALLCKAKELSIEMQKDTISTEDIFNALKTARPSLSVQERQKYELIHRRFTNSSIPENGTVVMSKRATMA